MIDPTTASAVITGIVSTLTAYMNYRVSVKQAEAQSKPDQTPTATSAKPDEAIVKQAETALPVVREGVKQYGDQREQTALANFESDPDMYGGVIEKVLTSIATREPEFLRQLWTATQQTTVQGRGINVSGDVYGNVIDQNTGTLNNTYNFGNRDNT
jgi:hypothetical protein